MTEDQFVRQGCFGLRPGLKHHHFSVVCLDFGAGQ